MYEGIAQRVFNLIHPLLLGVLFAGVSCGTLDLGDAPFLCNDGKPECPNGYTCNGGGICVKSGVCPADLPGCTDCGDGKCEGAEDCTTCPFVASVRDAGMGSATAVAPKIVRPAPQIAAIAPAVVTVNARLQKMRPAVLQIARLRYVPMVSCVARTMKH
jgi:hypothetical protein